MVIDVQAYHVLHLPYSDVAIRANVIFFVSIMSGCYEASHHSTVQIISLCTSAIISFFS